MTYRDRIAVGVDGSQGSNAAIRWAAREAERLGLDLSLVHVRSGYRAVGTFYSAAYVTPPPDDQVRSQKVLEDATREAAELLSIDRIDATAVRSDVRTGLLQAAAQARMLVLGDESHPALSRLVTGSVVAPVAAHSPVPVVVVPANWQDAASQGSVVMAVKNYDASAPLIRHGCQLAAAHGGRLVLLHAWDFLALYDDAIAKHTAPPDWEQRAQAELTALLHRIAREYPGVQTEVHLVHGQPAQVLVDASSGAGLLVISRHPHLLPYGHLGGTGRAVLRETRCPTIVLPAAAEPVDLAVRDEEADRLEAEGDAAFSRA